MNRHSVAAGDDRGGTRTGGPFRAGLTAASYSRDGLGFMVPMRA
jgi:hypothetical protein